MLKQFLIAPFLLVIKIYQIFLSPIFGSNCRFAPTCSSYSKQALKTHGLIKGLYLSVIRISKCHPWGASGYDPVPENNTKKHQK